MEEIFTYLGYTSHTLFFIHTMYQKIEKDKMIDMSGQIYNLLIHETMIKNNDKVVVFNVSVFGGITAVIIDHHTFMPMEYSKTGLEQIFKRLMTIERKKEKNMVIKYDGVKYELYEIEMILPFGDKKMDGLTIDDMYHVVSLKEIPYL